MPTLGLLLSYAHKYKLNTIDMWREEILVAFVCSFSHTSLQPILDGYHCQNYSNVQQICVCVHVCVCLHSTIPYCVTTPVVAFCYFICHVHTPQPGFCHSQLYFLFLFNTSPLQACTWIRYPFSLTAHS